MTPLDIIPLFNDMLPSGKGMLVMLQVYLDRGVKRDSTDEIATVASVIFKPTQYKQFVRPWKRMLKAWRASAFHATDFYNGAEEFLRNTPEREILFKEDSKRIPTMIGSHVRRIVFVSFRPKEFNQVSSQHWKAKYGTSTHSIAVQLCLIANGWWRHENCRSESFAYVMETGDSDQPEIVRIVEAMRNDKDTDIAKIIRVNSFTLAQKGTARGLEAADFVAWHGNKYYMDKIRTGKRIPPRKDFLALAASGKVHFMLATGNKLKHFLSYAPLEQSDSKMEG